MNVYDRIAAYLQTRGWTNRPNVDDHQRGGKICLGMAIDDVAPGDAERVRRALPETCVHRPRGGLYNQTIVHWNDEHATEEEVYALLDKLSREEEEGWQRAIA